MNSLIFLAFTSFALSLLLTPLVRNTALRLGFVDTPDDRRKTHKIPIPRVGGVAIFSATILAYILLLIVGSSASPIVRHGLPFAARLLPAIVLIFAVGLLDDIHGVRPWHKLAAQTGAALLAWVGGIHLGAIGGHPLPSVLSFLITIAWIVACSNAVNLIDGIDGLAVGVGLFATITTLIAGLLHGNMDLVFATAPLAGALIGFLRFNFNPASIFLGDCGSLTLGFLLGCFGIVWSEKSTTMLSMTAPLLALSVPLLDAGIAVARRFLHKQPIFLGDRSHIHHKLLSRGFTPRRVVLTLYGFCGLAAAASVMLTTTQPRYHGFVLILVCLTVWLGLQHLGYSEFGVAGRMALGGAFRDLLSAQLALIAFEQELYESKTVERCWEVLRDASSRFGFAGIELRLNGTYRHGELTGSWFVRIDLPGHGYIDLMRAPGATDRGAVAVLFVDCISSLLVRKLNELSTSHTELELYESSD
jgi:UDP-N-acetylmuramyl pentapeptide phosphotransferase/UDP-N-acetylglucosamine-1-phosphate transferase